MDRVIWTKELSVNVKELDEQHLKLVDFINGAEERIELGFDLTDFSNFFKEIKDYTETHFATEEKYFKQFDYEGAIEHVQIHNNIKSTILEFEERFKGNQSIGLIEEFIEHLKDLFFFHVMEYDKKYVNCFNQHGLH